MAVGVLFEAVFAVGAVLCGAAGVGQPSATMALLQPQCQSFGNTAGKPCLRNTEEAE